MPERKVIKDYQESAVHEVFQQATPSSWHDLVNYLEKKGNESWRLSPGEDAHMIADAKQAMKDNVPFAHNPEQAYRVMKSHRNPELVRQEEQKWLGKSEHSQQAERAARRHTA